MNKAWRAFRRWPIPVQVLAWFFVGLFVLGAVASEKPKSTGSPTNPTTPRPPSRTAPPSAAPTDASNGASVGSITDGDTLRLADGTRIRLIGIDTPDTGRCYAVEAAAWLSQLVPPGTALRLVYDVQRQDRYGRDLAYIYRAGDGLFVNRAMASDGYAQQLTVPPNVAHAEAFRVAVAGARTANRGLWAGCPTGAAFAAPTAAPSARPSEVPAVTTGAATTYSNCTEALAAGVAPIQRGQPGYSSKLDRDDDGIACET